MRKDGNYMKDFNKLLSVVKFLVEEGTKDVDLVRQCWVLLAKVIEPKPGHFRIHDYWLVGGNVLETKLNKGIIEIFFRL